MARTRNNFITDEEYDIALHKYYNNLVFDDHIQYKEVIQTKFKYKFDPKLIEEFLLEGEEYAPLNHQYLLTNYGRAFNARHRRFLKPKFYRSGVYVYTGTGNYTLRKMFKKFNWKFDKIEILSRYIKNGWSKNVQKECDYVHLAE